MVTDNLSIQELDVLERLDKLEQTLKSQDPQIPVHLANIHKTLQTYEELIHLLPDSKIRVLMEAMQKYRKVQLVTEAQTSRSRKSLSKTTEDDI
jgi:rubrerythrin